MLNHPNLADRRTALRSVTLGGQRIDLLQHDELEGAVDGALAGTRAPLLLASANLDHVYRFKHDDELFVGSPAGQWMVLLDGMPLVWASRRKTGRTWDKLAGSDLLPELLAQAEARGASVGFLGGTDSSLEPLARAIVGRWPNLRVSGHWTPRRAVIEDRTASAELAAAIRAAHTDILIVGLGKPRQEQWMARHAAATGACITGAFGASADFIAGVQKRAPELLCRVGLEWLYRLVHEPRRLARRYLVEGPVALARVMRSAA